MLSLFIVLFTSQVADYIPQLARFSPELWGVALCTVDGQRYPWQSCCLYCIYAVTVNSGINLHRNSLNSRLFVSPRHTVGDTKVPFCLQSCVKPLKYAVAVHDHGTEYVHRFIGKEPSGLRFNKLFLNEDGQKKTPVASITHSQPRSGCDTLSVTGPALGLVAMAMCSIINERT